MWYLTISCIAGVLCGLPGPIHDTTHPNKTREECILLGAIALDLASLPKTKFTYTCERRE